MRSHWQWKILSTACRTLEQVKGHCRRYYWKLGNCLEKHLLTTLRCSAMVLGGRLVSPIMSCNCRRERMTRGWEGTLTLRTPEGKWSCWEDSLLQVMDANALWIAWRIQSHDSLSYPGSLDVVRGSLTASIQDYSGSHTEDWETGFIQRKESVRNSERYKRYKQLSRNTTGCFIFNLHFSFMLASK